jgi:hypothetical protein
MAYYSLEMAEGIAGDYTTVGATTTAIYSCMGILFLNATSRRGGLYYYPAKGLENPYVQPTIIAMYNQLQPNRILLTPAKGDGRGSQGSGLDNVTKVLEFFQKLGKQVEVQQRENVANYFWEDGRLHVNENPPDTATRREMSKFEDTFNSQARTISTTVEYYGFNGEKHQDVLNSVSADDPKPRGRRRGCTIL